MSAQRRLLLVSPSFFGYEKDIAAAFADLGFRVDLRDERPSNSALARAVLRVRPGLMRRRLARHFDAILSSTRDTTYDHVVFVKAETVPRTFVEQLRKDHGSATFSLYTFDSLQNSGHLLTLSDLFDRRFTFDAQDAADHPDFAFKPLFYGPEFGSAAGSDERRYDLSFVGTLHSDRYAHITGLFEPRPGFRSFLFLHVQARWFFVLEKYVTRRFGQVDPRLVRFDKLAKADVARVFRQSVAVLDVQRANQCGLTMRTFEALACGAKLITTNPRVRDMDFFDEHRIMVLPEHLDRAAVQAVRQFLSAGAPDGPPPGFTRHSLRCWVEDFVS